MAGLSNILQLSQRSLMANQAAISTVGHNVANANTDGYSRQRVNMAATTPEQTSFGYLGSGVTVQSIERIRSSFLDTQIRSTNDSLGKAETQQSILSQIETMVNEPSDNGLSAELGDFFNSFQDLANSPEDSSARTVVVQKADLLAQTFQQLDGNLKSLQSNILSDVKSQLTQINSLTSEISTYNQQIIQANAAGASPNDLLDQRDLAIQKLSELAKVTVSEDKQGTAQVSIGGIMVTSASGNVPLSQTIQDGKALIVGGDAQRGIDVTSGKLGADLEAYNETIPSYQTTINSLASTLITQVNALHTSGYGLGSSPSTGIAFFTGSSASDIAVNSQLENNSNLVAASKDGTTGDNTIALAISNLQNSKVMNGNSSTMGDSYNSFVTTLGTSIDSANNTQSTQTLVLQQLNEQQSSVAGVSTDEETTNLIQYQRAYQASSEVINVVNTLFQSVLDMVQSL
jgi:flagellar hook-associated protein 1 FlgK